MPEVHNLVQIKQNIQKPEYVKKKKNNNNNKDYLLCVWFYPFCGEGVLFNHAMTHDVLNFMQILQASH